MSFFNFGPSPTKSSGHGQPSSNSEFNMFGAESAGQLFGGQEGISGGSIFGGTEESGGSLFSSVGVATPMKQEYGSGQGNNITPPLKKQRPEASYSTTKQRSGADISGIHITANSTTPHLTEEKLRKKAVVDTKVNGLGAPPSCEPSMVPGFPQHQRDNAAQTQASAVFHDQTTAPAQVEDKPSSVQRSVVKEEEIHRHQALDHEKEDGDLMSADQIFKDLLNKQRHQLLELLPELKASEEKSEEVLDNAMLVLQEVDNYSEKLAGIKQQYCSRLSQVSSFLKMIPKHEK